MPIFSSLHNSTVVPTCLGRNLKKIIQLQSRNPASPSSTQKWNSLKRRWKPRGATKYRFSNISRPGHYSVVHKKISSVFLQTSRSAYALLVKLHSHIVLYSLFEEPCNLAENIMEFFKRKEEDPPRSTETCACSI